MKKIIRVAFAATFACIADYGVYASQQESGLSELALANVEALANGESSKGYDFVYYPQPGDPNYGYTKCVCSGSGKLSCC